ncbi:MAG: hypothetical protein ACI8X5_004023 [Planctomycetota bacterium]
MSRVTPSHSEVREFGTLFFVTVSYRVQVSRPVCHAIVASLWTCVPGFAQEILIDVSEKEGEGEVSNLYVPYAFSSETYGLGVGLFASTTGRFQDQLSLYGAFIGSTNGSATLMLGVSDFRVPATRRLYADMFLSIGSYSNLPAYVDDPSTPGSNAAGRNDSDPDDLVRGEATEIWLELPFRYLLPIGTGAAQEHTYYLDRGLLAEGSTYTENWNPLESGRTYLGTEIIWKKQEFEIAEQPDQLATSGLAFSLEYDNTDFSPNPSAGSRQELRLQRDFGWLGGSHTWTTLEFEGSKYLSLSPTKNQRQRTLALNFWTVDTPTWEDGPDGVKHRPPYYEGATLGGFDRMRAYPTNRFNDQAAIFYSLEYRVIPAWHPLGGINQLRPLDLDWWQWVGFFEVGRVADSWNIEELHTSMKWDVGLSLRFMARKQIVRLDFAGGPEGFAVLFNMGQPF